jgi:hypothetical protein
VFVETGVGSGAEPAARQERVPQLAGTFQEDADYLAAWYSGWYNGLARKHVMQIARAKAMQHEVIVYCKANPSKKVIEAIDVVFKNYRTEKGITTKK